MTPSAEKVQDCSQVPEARVFPVSGDRTFFSEKTEDPGSIFLPSATRFHRSRGQNNRSTEAGCCLNLFSKQRTKKPFPAENNDILLQQLVSQLRLKPGAYYIIGNGLLLKHVVLGNLYITINSVLLYAIMLKEP